MATLSWMLLPDSKVERLNAQSGPHFASWSSAGPATPLPAVQLDLRHGRGGRNRRPGDRYRVITNEVSTSMTAVSLDDELANMRWDDVVDVVCAGTGVAGLASAIVASDSGLDVFVADGGDRCSASRVMMSAVDLPERLGVDESDAPTRDYLLAVSSGVETTDLPPRATSLPVATVANVDQRDGRVPPFVGQALRSWTSSCLASPYGALYTQVAHRNMTTFHTEKDGEIEAAVVGDVSPADILSGLTLGQYLSDQVNERNIAVHRSSPLRRLVFDEMGQVVGIVLATPDGARAVRARRGVVLASGGLDPAAELTRQSTPGKLCVMSRTASRFAQIGVLVGAR